MNLREKAQSLAALAEEKASALEAKLQKVSQSTEKEKIRLQNELAHLKSDSKLSVSRISADVGIYLFCLFLSCLFGHLYVNLFFWLLSLREWNAELNMQRKSQNY